MTTIKLTGTKKDKSKAFYEMITHGNTFSEIQDQFVIDECLLKGLDEKGFKYKVVR